MGEGVWPGKSPSMNPIENFRSHLKSKRHEEPVPRDRGCLIRRFRKVSKEISKTTLENLA